MKYKIIWDGSAKTLFLPPVQDNTVFAYDWFPKISEK